MSQADFYDFNFQVPMSSVLLLKWLRESLTVWKHMNGGESGV